MKPTTICLLAAEVLESLDELVTLALGAELSAETGLGELDGSLEGARGADLDEFHHVSLVRGEAGDFADDFADEGLLSGLLDADCLDLGRDEALVATG